ncbi:MAG: endonuclease III [Planctomycetota bacterium]|jgi:endonuclease-3|nr:endonuclease III [Planctomycetota bacterium]MDP6502320.1 endonuclease III [Planctomycetota bacterium]
MPDIDINLFLRRVRSEVKKHKTPAVTEVAKKRDPFRVLISCIISLRTKDEVTSAASRRLFARADTPRKMLKLEEDEIAGLIYPAGFYRNKAASIRAICEVLITEHEGKVPDTIDELVNLKGVGRKTANLVVTMGFNKPGICVDIHVHRISNRWGYIETNTPDESETALRESLPRRHWISYNDLLVTFGQNVCVPVSPKCTQCPLEELCPKVGVGKHR